MEAIRTKTTNAIYVGEGCNDLPCTCFNFEDGTPCIELCFRLNDDEMTQITMNNGHLFIHLLGRAVPPMYLDTKSALENGGPEE